MDVEKKMSDIAVDSEKVFQCPVAVEVLYIRSAQTDKWLALVHDGHEILAHAQGKTMEPVLTQLHSEVKDAGSADYQAKGWAKIPVDAQAEVSALMQARGLTVLVF
jgi:hypothetical protein